MKSGHMRVATINLWQRYGDWLARRELLADTFRTIKPDVVGFAESISTDDYDQVADVLGTDFSVLHSKKRTPEGMGISIASRWPLHLVQEVDLNVSPRTAGFPCATLIAKVVAPQPVGPLLFVNHFPNWQLDLEYERELQSVAAARSIEERATEANRQVVMVGDLDADPCAASIRFWCGRQSLGNMSVCFRDAWESTHDRDPGPTFSPANPLVRDQVVKGTKPFRDWPFRRIDYVFVRLGAHGGSAWDIVNCERFLWESRNGAWASDHFGLVADLATPEWHYSHVKRQKQKSADRPNRIVYPSHAECHPRRGRGGGGGSRRQPHGPSLPGYSALQGKHSGERTRSQPSLEPGSGDGPSGPIGEGRTR
jgi:endonuclease/exonuclease/phosphatase family metal-dependent hydrolase